MDRVDRAVRRWSSSTWVRRVYALTDLAQERRIVALSRSDADDLFRTRLLQWHLDRLRGGAPEALDPPRAGFSWLGHEPWFAARALGPGPLRVEAMLRALDEAGAPDRAARLAAADQQVRSELAAANPGGAADLAGRLDELDPGPARCALAAWAAAQAGRAAEFEPRLAARLASAVDLADEALLRVARARLRLAAGDELGARVDLGAAAAAGSADAATLAARLLLERGEADRARVFLRGFVAEPGVPDSLRALWALAVVDGIPRLAADPAESPANLPVR
ncbi:MAG: hypothetical protein JNK02_15550 [Planctomycetes bacterium]|nr:hypothetical protein [Planctomycetota bacterium]